MQLPLRKLALLLAVGLVTSVGARAEEVNVYNARHYGTDLDLWKGFEAATGIRVNVVEGAHDQLIQRLQAEGENSPADLFITVDAGRLAFAVDSGLLAPMKSAALDAAIPEHLRHPLGLWYGLAVRARIVAYAKDRVDPEQLSTYEQLADPMWKGRLLVRSSTNTYNLSLVGSLLFADGPDATFTWCEGVVANLARPPEGGDTDQLKAVAAGVGDIAISNTYYLARLQTSAKAEEREIGDKLAVFFPNQENRGTHVNITGAGMVKSAPHPENALKLVEYLASPEGQRYFADISLEYPVNPAVPPHPALAAWGNFKQDTLNAAIYAQNSQEAAKLTDRCGWR